VPESGALAATVVEMVKLADAKLSILTDNDGVAGDAAHFRGTCAWGGDSGSETPCIVFNGIGDDGHETFGFPLAPFTNNPAFSFVKTARKPYDVVAVACLIVARDHFSTAALEISSDGTWAEFAEGARLYQRTLGRAPHDPLSPRAEVPLSPTAEDESAREGSTTDAPSPGSVRKRWLVAGLFVVVVLGVLVVFREKR
jgi:hypothetical protein